MDPRIPPTRPDVTIAQTVARPTPRPPRVRFSEVLAKGGRSLVQGAESALRTLPGGPLMAVAVRGGSGSVPMSPMSSHGGSSSPVGRSGISSAEGPGGASPPGMGGAPGGTTSDGGVESSLAQSQEMNMYYLQIQETVNAQNRTFSALSNVLKAEHDTVKTAIGNIR